MTLISHQLPLIDNQGNQGFCGTYAVAAVADFLLGDGRQVDPVALFKEISNGTDASGENLGQILSWGKLRGLPLRNSADRVYVDTMQQLYPITPQWISSHVKNAPCVFTMRLPVPMAFDNCIDPKTFIFSVPSLIHHMAITGFDDSQKLFTIANSWGADWMNKGYFCLNYRDMNSTDVVCVYSFTLKK